jgi:hypothetical protein
VRVSITKRVTRVSCQHHRTCSTHMFDPPPNTIDNRRQSTILSIFIGTTPIQSTILSLFIGTTLSRYERTSVSRSRRIPSSWLSPS